MNPEGVLFASAYKNVETNVWKGREIDPRVFARNYIDKERFACAIDLVFQRLDA